MIFFCEDCGKKNFLDKTELKDGKVLFRCSSCNYQNSYYFKEKQEKYVKKIDLFFKEIKQIDEIIGLFLFNTKRGVLKNNMPVLLEAKDLDLLGKMLVKNYLICLSLYTDINEMTVFISDKTMVVRQINNNLFILLATKKFPLSQKVMVKLTSLAATCRAQQE